MEQKKRGRGWAMRLGIGLTIAAGVTQLALTLSSWLGPPNGRVIALRRLTAEEAQIIEAARQYFLAKGETLADVEFRIPVRYGEGWLVHVAFRPTCPGSHGTFEIDKNGKVIRYWGGA